MKSESSAMSLNTLAENVLSHYDIMPDRLDIIQNKGLKTLWKVTCNHEIKCLKRLKHDKGKALFTVNAQMHIFNTGGAVPQIHLNCEGKPITEYMGQLFVLYEWIEGRDLNFGKPSDLRLAIEGLSKFHAKSKGYKAPEEAKISSKFGRWPQQYESMMNRMLKWKEEAKGKSQNRVYNSYLQNIDGIIEIGHMAVEALHQSAYGTLTGIDLQKATLCHQDYGEGNAIFTGDILYVIDLDGVTYDLPSRDLRKIIGKRMEKRGQWQKETIEKIVRWYDKNNALSPEEKAVLKIDLLFPHWFFATVKNLFKKNKKIKPSEIVRISTLEQSKVTVLKDLF